MSSFPSNRPQAPSQGRPASGGSPAATTLDPVKLIKKYAWALPIVLIVGLGLGSILFITLRVFFPRYTAEVTFAVQNQVDPEDLGKGLQIDDDEIERFMSTQRDRMTSESVLRAVAGEFAATAVHGDAEARAHLTRLGVGAVEEDRHLAYVALLIMYTIHQLLFTYTLYLGRYLFI